MIALALNARGHTIVTEGVYRFIRYLMYASIWLWGIAQTLLLQNWIASWASIVLIVPMNVLRVSREEQMIEQFGEA
jgi:protein-S-isoprenylcysteine O-methyltransferase Ste14